MATNEKSEGPQIGQMVLYNNSGTIVPAVIYAISASTGLVSLVFFNASGATNAASKSYDATQSSGTWSYMPFF
jgi:hypothetical protein